MERLRNNPALAGLFENTDLAQRLNRNTVLTDSQKGYTANQGNTFTSYPNRAYGTKTSAGALAKNAEVKQVEFLSLNLDSFLLLY